MPTLLTPVRFARYALPGLLALGLLLMTLLWSVPMMLWDHLDLVPILQAWQRGNLADSGFLHMHGGHMHTAAYAVLLVTTTLSGGQPWLDVVVSWLFLLAYAAIVLTFARETFPGDSRRDAGFTALIAFLALFPGHLANLQWGWQVAVFLCLTGVALTIFALTRARLDWRHLLLALPAAALAYFSFATAIALFPTALILVALRRDCSLSRRMAMSLPWIAASVLALLPYRDIPSTGSPLDMATLALYALNFLGAGITRFATDLAPWLALAAMVSGIWAGIRCHRQRECLPWLGLLLFACFAAVLVALGRAAPFGSEHAFVTRYVSFSSLFWIGWTGLIACACRNGLPAPMRIGVALVALLAIANGLHMIRKAEHVSAQSHTTATTIRTTWPQVDRRLLGEIYFDQPEIAAQRLQGLHAMGFPPFDSSAEQSLP